MMLAARLAIQPVEEHHTDFNDNRDDQLKDIHQPLQSQWRRFAR